MRACAWEWGVRLARPLRQVVGLAPWTLPEAGAGLHPLGTQPGLKAPARPPARGTDETRGGRGQPCGLRRRGPGPRETSLFDCVSDTWAATAKSPICGVWKRL